MANARRLFAGGLLLLMASGAAAATRTWAGATGNWSNPANWVGGVAPLAGDDLVFPAGAAAYTATNDYPSGTPFQSLTLAAGAGGAATLAGNAISLGAGGISAAQHLARIALPIRLAADQTWQLAQLLELRQPTDIDGRTLTIDNGASVAWRDTGHAGSGQVIVNGGSSPRRRTTAWAAAFFSGAAAGWSSPSPIPRCRGTTRPRVAECTRKARTCASGTPRSRATTRPVWPAAFS